MKKITKDNKGFSLVELIIVIAIMAILAGAITISVIRYINRARKSNDINGAEAIGKAFQNACINDEDMMVFIQEATTTPNMPGTPTASQHYRILGYASAISGNRSDSRMDFQLTNFTLSAELAGVDIEGKLLDLLNETLIPLKFKRAGKVDEWIVCVDPQMNFFVYVGSGMSPSVKFMDEDDKTDAGVQCYRLWPNLSNVYDHFVVPSDIP